MHKVCQVQYFLVLVYDFCAICVILLALTLVAILVDFAVCSANGVIYSPKTTCIVVTARNTNSGPGPESWYVWSRPGGFETLTSFLRFRRASARTCHFDQRILEGQFVTTLHH